jgi:guanylate kinase
VRKGLLCVLSSPSGGGKTSVIREILRRRPEFGYSLSATTRPKRGHEVDGKDYYFLTREAFLKKIKAGDFVEWAEVHGQLYGTPKSSVESQLAAGKVVLLDIDVDGGLQIRRLFPEQSLLIFLLPPSLEVLIKRLQGRSTETEEQIKKRLERVPKEITHALNYDVLVVNDDFNKTVEKVMRLIDYNQQILAAS